MRQSRVLWESVVAVLALIVSIGGAIGTANGMVSAQPTTAILNQQEIEIPDMLPIGLSPDGTMLAAAAANRRTLCTYTVPAMTEITCADLEPLQAGLRLADVSWSPDSTRLVLAENSFVYLRDGDLWIMDARSGSLTDITDDGYLGEYPLGGDGGRDATFALDVAPAWTPNGQSIAFSRSTVIDGEPAGNEIVLIPAGGGDPEVLLTVSHDAPGIAYFSMHWSQDGESLYYSLTPLDRGDPSIGLYRYDVATGESEHLLGVSPDLGAPVALQVSPGGDRLLIIYPEAAGMYGLTQTYLWLFDLATGELSSLLPPNATEQNDGIVAAATFSPDGASILAGTRATVPDFQLWEIDIDSGAAIQLAEELPGVMMLEWSLAPSWTASGLIFVPAGIGSGTLLEVPPRAAPAETAESTASPDASSEALPSFGTGDRAIVIADGVPLHAGPTGLSPATMLLDAGDLLTVLGPVEEEDGVVWLPVQETETRTIGFVRVELVVKA